MSDFFAIYYYRENVQWAAIKKLLPWMMLGVVVGVVVGDKISLVFFKNMMATIILISGIMMIFLDKFTEDTVPDNRLFGAVMGSGAGFTTMIGNVAGAFTNLYFLALRYPKNKFIATGAYLFFFINLFKLPFHIFVWNTVSIGSISKTAYLYPIAIVGFYVGLRLIKYISNELFRKYIIAITIIGALLIFLK